MKFFLILPFIVFNLFALTKSATYPDFKVNSTNLTGYRGDNAGCMNQYNDINSYAPANSNVTANATYEQACNDVNPDASKLKILSINLEKSYTADPACTPVDEKADGTYAYKLYFYTHENVQCTYECNNKNTPPDNSGDYVFDETSCTWSKPCTDDAPAGWLAYPMSDGSCVPYEGSLKEKYATPGGMVCNVCYAPPYDEHSCTAPRELDTSVNPPRCVDVSNLDNPCRGANITGGGKYPINQYSYYGIADDVTCDALLSSIVDNVLLYSDIEPSCSQKYCYFHSLTKDCNHFNAVDYLPDSSWSLKSANDEDSCLSYVTSSSLYDNASFIYPDMTNCPNTAYCFVHPIQNNHNDNNNSLGTNESDINSTSDTDLQPLLNSQNDTNKHLEHINDKLDTVNNNLDDLKDTSKDILVNNQDMKKDLDKLSLNSDKSLDNQLKELSSLDNLNSNTKSNGERLNSINRGLRVSQAVISGKLTDISSTNANINKNIYDGLFSDHNFDTNFTDGSENFGALSQQLKDNLDVTYQTGLFNLSSASPEIPTITFSLVGHSFVLLSPAMFASLPIAQIRSIILFVFALAGFATVIRTI
jgi:hypothetical protein